MDLVSLLVAIFTVLAQSSSAKQPLEPCPAVGPGLFGDFRFHHGCRLDGHTSHELPEDKMRPSYWTASNLKVKQTSPLQWLDSLADQLVKSTHYVNHLNEYSTNTTSPDSCGKSCMFMRSSVPQCCQVETRTVFPMYGRSITSGKYVRIVQEADRDGFVQPIVYRHCQSENTMLVKGRCRQSVLPRVIYVTSETPTGYPYRQDLISVPSNCECIVSLVASGSDAHPPLPPPPTTTVPRAKGRSVVTSNIEASGEGSDFGSGDLAQQDDFIVATD